MSRRDWTELAAAYVLDALEPEERAAFEAELARNAGLKAEVGALTEATTALGKSVPQVAPPPALRDRVLREARESSSEPGPLSDDGTTAEPSVERRRRVQIIPWLAAAASIAAALWFASTNSGLRTEIDQLRQGRSVLEDALLRSEAEVARQDSILETISGPDVRAAALAPADGAPSLRVFLDPNRDVLVIAAFDLPPAPAGRTYQLWGIAGGQDPISLGTFDTGPQGTALLAFGAPADADFDVSAVTEEPSGGSPQPTTQPFLIGNWAALD